jgi:hypothetical protein
VFINLKLSQLELASERNDRRTRENHDDPTSRHTRRFYIKLQELCMVVYYCSMQLIRHAVHWRPCPKLVMHDPSRYTELKSFVDSEASEAIFEDDF